MCTWRSSRGQQCGTTPAWPPVRPLSAACGVLFLSLVFTWSAQAHLMGRGHGTLNVVKNKAYIVMSVSVSVFAQSGAGEAVSDGVLTAGELKTHNEALREAIRAGLTVQHGQTPVTFSSILLNLPKGAHHAAGRSGELMAMIVAPLDQEAGIKVPIEVKNTLWGATEKHLKFKATVTEAGKTVRSELFELTPTKDRHSVFRAVHPKPVP